MAGPRAFQINAFQHNAFQTATVTSTLGLSLPVNCVMAGNQPIKATGRTFEGAGQRVTFKPRMTSPGRTRLG